MKAVLPLLLTCLFSFIYLSTSAQTQILQAPYQSPKSTINQTVGLTDIAVTYYRPAAKERAVWGELISYGNMWRTGANYNTVIKFSDDVKIEGETLKAGKYGLHTIPEKDKVTVVFSNNTTSWGSFSYNKAEDALRVEVPLKKTEHFYEYLTIEFDDLAQESAVCAIKWADYQIPFRVEVDVHTLVLASFREQLQTKAGWSWQGWNEAANYCLVNDVNHQEALGWATRSAFMNPTPQNLITKARLTGKVKSEGDEAKASTVALETLDKDLGSLACTWKEYNAAANFAMQNKQFDKALVWSDKSVAMNPNMTNMMAKSQILAAKGDEKGAAKVKSVALEKGSNAELNNYGYQLLNRGKPAEAVMVFEANTKKNPTDPNVWDSLGEGYLNNGQKEKAIEAFKKSLSMNPPPNVKANSTKLLKQLGVEYDGNIKP